MKIFMNLRENSYDILVERGILHHAGEQLHLNRRVLIVTDSGVPQEYAQILSQQCKTPVICTVGFILSLSFLSRRVEGWKTGFFRGTV